jgi:flagellar hook protein FlgE
MSFNIGLSALSAAQQEINVTGNNIANAGTSGFKGARAVFGDVYSASILGGGGTQAGAGVVLQEIKQSFNQGNISFTNNTLDLAINGEGFFIMRGDSGFSYTRAGSFGTDRDGFIVNSGSQRLQGFAPTDRGQATGGGPLTDLRVTTGEIQPRPTTGVETRVNLDASAQPSSVIGANLTANGGRSTAALLIPILDPRVNGYQSNSIEIVGPDRSVRKINLAENSSANAAAQLLAGATGVSAKGVTVAFLSNLTAPATETTRFSLNGRQFAVDPADADALSLLASSINASANNISAVVEGTNIKLTHATGADLNFIAGALGNGSLTVTGSEFDSVDAEYIAQGAGTALTLDGANVVVVGGTLEIVLDEGYTLRAAETDINGDSIDQTVQTGSIFGDISNTDALEGANFETNKFDPRDPDTYYRSTAVSVFDTVGTAHSLAMYFVKERSSNAGETNLWSVYFQVDNRNIGYDPNATDGQPSLARYDLRFDDTGRFDPNQNLIEITNWSPIDSGGRRIGAGPIPGNTNVSDVLTNSNFTIDLSGMTAFGGDFSVQSNNQDGFAKGQLTGLEINVRGLVSARFSNGQSRVLGEVALGNFANPNGLANPGGTNFAETSESGAVSVSGAGTAGLGAIQSGALEDSNVDLPTELVQLIISQRNYQAAAQIISAADDVTQTIINL